MSEILRLGDISIELIRKEVKHAHLSVHPPDGRVTLVAPKGTRIEVARAYAVSKLAWIRKQRTEYAKQARATG
ncbi:MAG: M48 family metallopeptidase, partial [Armatimonadetes bacterium]|nr:M48 family metallopeptidase [Armatimonadota bacterium]